MLAMEIIEIIDSLQKILFDYTPTLFKENANESIGTRCLFSSYLSYNRLHFLDGELNLKMAKVMTLQAQLCPIQCELSLSSRTKVSTEMIENNLLFLFLQEPGAMMCVQ
jgi:hypothetical protein